MGLRLPTREFLPFAPEDPGTVRINHDSPSCSGSSKSLKITRTEDDRVFAKCYRCGGFGSHNGSLSSFGAFARSRAKNTPKSGTDLTLPSDFSNEIKRMPVEVRLKLDEGGINQKHVDQYGMGWSDKWQRFIIPVYRDGEIKGLIARYFGTDDLPKYVTRYKDDSDLWTYIDTHHADNYPVCTIVEDMWSAIRVSKFCPSIALLGTEMGDKCLDHAANLHEKFLIFLDDDNLMVKKKAVQIMDRLTMMGKRVKIISSGGIDPKEFRDFELRKIIEDSFNAL